MLEYIRWVSGSWRRRNGLRDCGVDGRGRVADTEMSWRICLNDDTVGGFDDGYRRNVRRRSWYYC